MKRWLKENRAMVIVHAIVYGFVAFALAQVGSYHRKADKALGAGVQQCRCVCGAP